MLFLKRGWVDSQGGWDASYIERGYRGRSDGGDGGAQREMPESRAGVVGSGGKPAHLVPSHVDLGKAALSNLLVNDELADVAAARLARAGGRPITSTRHGSGFLWEVVRDRNGASRTALRPIIFETRQQP